MRSESLNRSDSLISDSSKYKGEFKSDDRIHVDGGK
jgi:hypothetical protein